MAGKPGRSGRPKGFDKEQARQRLRELVSASLDAMTEAQIAAAQGVKYFVVRDAKTGRFLRRIKEAAAFDKALESEGEVLEVWAEPPSTGAFTDLLNRTIDKPTEQVATEHSGKVELEVFWRG